MEFIVVSNKGKLMKQWFNLVKLIRRYFFIFCSLALSSCSTSPLMPAKDLALAQAHPNLHFEQEVMVMGISQMLELTSMTNQQRASLFLERGSLFDSLGLWGMASYDFIQAANLQPNMVDAYNFLGLYALLNKNYQDALDLFNMVLSFDANYEYSYFNRGLALYYAGRFHLAQQDFMQFYNRNQTDPYRVLWLYLNELKLNPQEALNNLKLRAVKLSDEHWGSKIVQYYLAQISLDTLYQQAQLFEQKDKLKYAEILTETYFYLAKQQLNLGQIKKAQALFKLAMANQVYNFVEYRFAMFELMKLSSVQTK